MAPVRRGETQDFARLGRWWKKWRWRRPGRGEVQHVYRIFFKMDWFTSNQDQSDQQPILHILWNTFQQRKYFVFALFVYVSACQIPNIPFVHSILDRGEKFIFLGKLPFTLVNSSVPVYQCVKSHGHWKRSFFAHIFGKSGSIYIKPKPKSAAHSTHLRTQLTSGKSSFLADRTNSRACYSVASVCLSVCSLSSVVCDVCIVVKRCVLKH